VLVPLRGVFEALGAQVRWLPAAREVRVVAGDKTVRLPIHASVAYTNGRRIPLEVPAQIVRGRTLVPLRFVAEALGAEVEWLPDQRLVQVKSPSTAPRAVKVKEVIEGAKKLQGKEVVLSGVYQGWRPPSGPATKAGPPVTRSDWGFADDTGAIYVTKGAPPLDPYADRGKPVKVWGIVRISPRGIVYIEATKVSLLPSKGR
jgi:hypothetical protein